MNILVTGGAGFIGSHIVDRLIAEGHRAVVVDDLSTGKKENINAKAKFHKIDICDAKIKDIVLDEKIDVICHQAAQKDLRLSVKSPAYDAQINILGSINLFEAGVAGKVKKIVFASTGGAIYGEQEKFPAPETHPSNPLSPYGIAKFSVEKYLFYYRHVYGVNFIALRYSNVYGPRQDSHGEAGVVAIFAEKMLKGEKTLINGDGKQTRDFVYVEDVADANMRAVGHAGSDIFNVGTAVEIDINALWEKLKSLTGYGGGIAHGPAKDGEQMRSVIDSGKIKKALGWAPRTCLDEGLSKTVEWFRERAGK